MKKFSKTGQALLLKFTNGLYVVALVAVFIGGSGWMHDTYHRLGAIVADAKLIDEVMYSTITVSAFVTMVLLRSLEFLFDYEPYIPSKAKQPEKPSGCSRDQENVYPLP